MPTKICALLLIFCLVLGIAIAPVYATETVNGAKIFETNCAGCHLNGGNIIRRGKTLKKKALTRYKMDTLEAVMNIVSNGKGVMSAYSDRLSATEIETVANYVLKQAENDWN
ncbi:MAG: cytochrome c6 PetJ [Microcystaceae cyanobacterium]